MTKKREFTDQAVSDMADKLSENMIENASEKEAMRLFRTIKQTCVEYEIPPRRRVEFAVEGLEKYMNRQKEEATTQFREALEEAEHMLR